MTTASEFVTDCKAAGFQVSVTSAWAGRVPRCVRLSAKADAALCDSLTTLAKSLLSRLPVNSDEVAKIDTTAGFFDARQNGVARSFILALQAAIAN
jgi:hypothetical protein